MLHFSISLHIQKPYFLDRTLSGNFNLLSEGGLVGKSQTGWIFKSKANVSYCTKIIPGLWTPPIKKYYRPGTRDWTIRQSSLLRVYDSDNSQHGEGKEII